MAINHSFTSPIADGTNTQLVRPSNWNAEHIGTFILSAGTQTAGSNATVILSNSNNISFGISGNSIITASHNALTSQSTQYNAITLGGNTAGTTSFNATDNNSIFLYGGNNITLSGNGSSITISGAAAGGGQTGISGIGASNSTYTSGTVIFSGQNNITVGTSIDGASQYVRLSAPNATVFSNSNNVSFGLNASTITATATFAQTNQTANFYVSSNTTQLSSTAGIDLRSITFQGAGIASIGVSEGKVLVSVAGAGADGYNSAQFTNSTANSTQPILWAGNSNGSGNLTFGLTGSTVTGSAPSGGGGNAISYWDNGMMSMGASASSNGTFFVFPLNPVDDIFPANMTVNTMAFNISASSNISNAHSYTWRIGLYTNNVSTLSLLNSVSTTWGYSANANNSQAISGVRWLTIHSSLWSAAPVLSQAQYWMGVVGHSSGADVKISLVGMSWRNTVIRSKVFGSSITSGNTTMGWHLWGGMSSVSRSNTNGLPTSITIDELRRATALGGFIPHVVFNNVNSNF